MAEYVYGDVLFAINFAMNALILWGTSRFTDTRAPATKIAAASAVGACYSVAAAWTGSPAMESAWAKLIVAFVMVVIAFGARNAQRWIRLTACAVTFSFLVAGATMAAWAASYGTRAWVYPLKWWALAVATPLAVSGARSASGLLKRRRQLDAGRLRVRVVLDGAVAEMTGFVDTGNRLADPVTGDPVLVAEYSAIRALIPEGVRDAVASGDLAALACSSNCRFLSRMRVLPFTTLGEDRGIMIGFRPDSIVVECKGREYAPTRGVVAVCRGPLCPDGLYNALLHPDILEVVTETG
ncbi:MAG: sigma-E processing peptidase SpoIIGA [Firmicutes bacterium]|jgi:stage II sporulation protein GA (sporulation sigma-E factor processing peptidase)|nr:sigma-E processing peptidase SpoIIGA [Bacillota bacterium]